MKWFFRAVFVFAALLLFLPESGSAEPRNTELLLVMVCSCLFCLALKAITFMAFVMRIKKRLTARRFAVKACRYSLEGCYLVAEYDGVRRHECLHIHLMRRKNGWYRYHFASDNTIEFYTKIQFMARTNRGVMIGRPETVLAGKRKLTWKAEERDTRMVLFPKLPNNVSDPIRRDSINAGETVTDFGIVIHDEKSFERSLGD